MTTVVGIRFREVGKIYYFDPGELELKAGDNVIVDTVRGTEFGTVMIGNRKVEDEEIVQPLKVVRRKAGEDDVERVKANREKEKNAFAVCKEKVRERGLEMKLISAEYTFDNAKILFYFTADGRVDFRELVKDLAAVFRIRIELRQVGVRDETKLMGGLGGCGRPLCCASYLSDFVPVSIRMAKEQNLSLNPQKISGVCGRLMCCLKNEADTYEDLNTRLPKDGGKVITPDGREGIAETVNVLRERVRVLFTDDQGNREMEEFPASELQFTPRRKPKPCECKAAKQEEEAYDLDASELVAEADSEADPDIKALVRAEAADVMEERENDDVEANMVGEKKRRRRRRRRRPDADSVQGRKPTSDDKADSTQGNNVTSDNNATAHNSTTAHNSAAAHNSANRENAGQDADGNAADGQQSERRRRRHHRHNPKNNVENGGSGENGDSNNRSAGNNNRNVNNSDAGSNKQNQNDSVNSQQEKQQPQGGEGTEKKHNGAHRRFRKRWPKNTSES